MNRLALSAISLLFLATSSHAVVDGFAKTLTSGSASYTVPAGKVVILQQVQLPSSASGSSSLITIQDASNGQSTAVFVPGANTNIYRFATPLHLPAGTVIGGPTGSGNGGLYGLLVDVADMYLFVSVSSTITNVQFANNMLTGELRVASTVPVTIRFQSSTDLVNWNYDVAVALRPGTDRTRFAFAAAVQDKGRFYRAIVRRNDA